MSHEHPIHLTDEQRKMTMENISLVHYVMNLYGAQGLRFDEDAFQTGTIGLMRAAALYNPSRGRFSTYATRCIQNALWGELQYRQRPCRNNGQRPLSLDAPNVAGDEEGCTLMDTLADDGPSIEEQVIDKDTAHRIAELLEDMDTPEAKMALDYWTSGDTLREVAERHSVSRQWILDCANRMRQLVKERLAAEEGMV